MMCVDILCEVECHGAMNCSGFGVKTIKKATKTANHVNPMSGSWAGMKLYAKQFHGG